MSMVDKIQKNVLGEDLEECSKDPLTGWFRDGCCNTDENDHGLHTVCVKVNDQLYKNSNLSLKEYLGSKEIKISVGKKKIGILKLL